MLNLSTSALHAAVKVAVEEGLIKKEVSIDRYLQTWSTVNRMIEAAIKQDNLEKFEERRR